MTHRLERLQAAFAYAAEAHSEQLRKGTTTPYLAHLMGVSSLVLEFGGDEEQAIAGLLHDVVEDCGAEHEAEVRTRFGARVAEIVMACTDGVPDAAGAKPPWRERKDAYLRHLAEVSEGALLVSVCDKIHNARAIAADLHAGHDVFTRFKAGREDTLWYYAALLGAFESRFSRRHPAVLELAAAVARMSAPESTAEPIAA